MRMKFTEQLHQLNVEMIRMGSMIQKSIQDTIEAFFNQDAEKAKQWIANGAQPTDTVKIILKNNGVL